MLSLVKIRVKYIIRNPCLLFWTYILIPGIIVFSGIYQIIDKKKKNIETYEKSIINQDSPKVFFDDYDKMYDNLLHYRKLGFLNFAAFIAENTETCDKIKKYLDKHNIHIRDFSGEPKIYEDYQVCTTKESNLSNTTINIIKIEKKEKKYRVDLKCRGGNDTEYLKIYRNSTFDIGKNKLDNYSFFNSSDLDESMVSDAFYTYNGNITKNTTKLDLFFELQSLVARLILYLEGKEESENFRMYYGFNKYPDSYRVSEGGESTMESLISFLVTLEFALISYNINMRMIDEKEHKLNKLLERQGISKSQYNLSWFFTHFAVSSISIIGFILLLIGTTYGHYYLTIINVLLYSLSLFTVCLFFTVCISTTKTGATAIKFYHFGSLFLGFVIVSNGTIKITKVVFCFIPHINFFVNYYVTYCLGNFEKLSFNLLFLRANKTGYFESMIMYIVDILFYFLLYSFIQSYKDSGLPFCSYLKSFFTKVSRNVININLQKPINNAEEIINEDEDPTRKKYFQELTEINRQKSEQNQCLKLINVSKSFDDVQAVKSFNGELFSNEIFCLLGHNGAGKSTTINMISGIYDPDEGDILLDGRSLVTDKKYLYQNIGLCQQEDIYFEYLTVEEHLRYMCEIKGSQIDLQEINDLINKIDLAQKKNALCKTLSGGQKRKLCIALALIGNSRIILLDEPTSGMDVMARRSLWEFLKNYKKDKIILLTTHFLDEAEYLGDRIGIMTDGEYLCCGTSSYLKSKYPCGFNINLIVNSDIFNENYKNELYQEILKYEPKAEIKVASKGVFSINILSNNQHINEIFDYIDKSKQKYGIEDFTVASTSLEDVFLKINNKANLGDQKYSEKSIFSNSLSNMNILPKASGFCTQFCAQIIRGFYPFYRNKALFFFELLAGVGPVYIYVFFFSDILKSAISHRLNLIDVLSAHKIYYNGIDKEFFEKSDTYNTYGTYITLAKIEGESKDINDFMDKAYDNSFVNIAKGSLCVKNIKDENTIYEVYNTETNNKLYGYLYADTMFFVSAFLKKHYDIEATIFPEINQNSLTASTTNIGSTIMDYLSLIIVCVINFFGYVIFLGGLMLEKIKEKRTNIKHLLYLSGSNLFSYWLGFYIVDFIKLLIFTIVLILPLYTINNTATFFGLDLLVINISALSFIYFISFFCSQDDEGAKVLFLFVFSFILVIVLLMIAFPDDISSYILNFTDAYKPTFFDMTPITSMVLSLIRISLGYAIWEEMDKNSPFKLSEDIIPIKRAETYLYTSYLCQGINVVVYTILLIIAENGLLGKLIHSFDLCCYAEPDIKNIPSVPNFPNNNEKNNNYDYSINNSEAPLLSKPANIIPLENSNLINTNTNNVVMNQYSKDQMYQNNSLSQQNLEFNFTGMNPQGDPLKNPFVEEMIRKVYSQKELTTRIINVTKTFYPCCACCRKERVRAINHLHLGLEPNEKFGLLGFNGSGKTTTFRAITNEILTDSGSINLFGYDTKKQFNNIRTIIGYCPQINPLFDFMKVREIVKFYSKLKTNNDSVEETCRKFGLSRYLDTYTINLSGGNKRKLTFAIAMMNRPSLLLLDEPSTGVDPESRRIMWRNINELSNSGHKYNMVLTTHSMEEAEILCDTVSWFKAGNFITLGNPEKLKIKYSAGYKLHIKFNSEKISQQSFYNIEATFNQICEAINGFKRYTNYILANQNLEPYLISLMNFVQKIRDKIRNVSLYLMRRDFSFELIIQIIDDKKKDLFCDILNMKNTDETIDELMISMQSLENILTSLN